MDNLLCVRLWYAKSSSITVLRYCSAKVVVLMTIFIPDFTLYCLYGLVASCEGVVYLVFDCNTAPFTCFVGFFAKKIKGNQFVLWKGSNHAPSHV